MRVAVPIAAYCEGTTGVYVERAFKKLGHEAQILNQYEFFTAFSNNSFDLFFCVDSGGPLNFFDSSIGPDANWQRLCFWLLDFRRGKLLKNPNDHDTALRISEKGGHIFQGMVEDVAYCQSIGVKSVSLLPVAADPEVWSDEPKEAKIYDVGFVGNCWDGIRVQVLDMITASGLSLCFPGHGVAQMESGAKLLRQSKVGFNISSFYGESIAYDINMRVWEELSCGLPIITNYVPSMAKVFGDPLPSFMRVYTSIDQIIPKLKAAVHGQNFLDSGTLARKWILENGTYTIRMQGALDLLRSQGRI